MSLHAGPIKGLQSLYIVQDLPGSLALNWGWSGNKTEDKKTSSSSVLKKLDRPDMLIWAEGATVYIGEDKVMHLMNFSPRTCKLVHKKMIAQKNANL
jgi:hypothetical protein